MAEHVSRVTSLTDQLQKMQTTFSSLLEIVQATQASILTIQKNKNVGDMEILEIIEQGKNKIITTVSELKLLNLSRRNSVASESGGSLVEEFKNNPDAEEAKMPMNVRAVSTGSLINTVSSPLKQRSVASSPVREFAAPPRNSITTLLNSFKSPVSLAPIHERSKSLSLEDIRIACHSSLVLSRENKVRLNIGGTLFVTSLSTLTATETMLSQLVVKKEQEEEGAFFIDRDPTLFRYILNFLRDGSLNFPADLCVDLLKEARFYQVQGMISYLETKLKSASEYLATEPSSEKQFKLLTVEQKDLTDTFRQYTVFEGYEFENWLVCDGKINLLFSKSLSKGELALIERLQRMSS